MAVQLTWSPKAENDLRDLIAYIATENPDAASKLALSVIEKVELLGDFPEMGRMVPERQDPLIREIICHPYRIVYRLALEKTHLQIVRIWHAARGIPDLS